jgi:DNA/RNA-binding domain of Phe-tRNA-synthetase-like protein
MSATAITSLGAFEHPYLDVEVLSTDLRTSLGSLTSPVDLVNMLSLSYRSPFENSADLKSAVRRLLRHGGFKPSGRNKPASEYLVQAVSKNRLSSINPVVDAVNVASLHSGLPVSVVDADKLVGAPHFVIGRTDERYIFNVSGQTIDIDGLLCLADDEGPCANAVKDSQRTKTGDATTRILTIIWGTTELSGRTKAVGEFYRRLLDQYVVFAI